MLRKLLAVAVLTGSLTGPALATEWMYCGAGDVQIGLLLGFSDTISVVAATMDVGPKHWATNEAYGKGGAISISEASVDADETYVVHVRDAGTDKPLATLRVFTASYGNEAPVFGGTLVIEGEGAWAITCDGY